jgi:hypothetical protein
MTGPRADTAILNALHNEVAKALLERIKSGEAKAADIAAAVKFLADNAVKALPDEDATGGLKAEIAKLLPFNNPPDPGLVD